MKARPILFSAPMVRAILDGSKTQTRRIVKPQPPEDYDRPYIVPNAYENRWIWHTPKREPHYPNGGTSPWHRCPYGVPGDRLWVKETHSFVNIYGACPPASEAGSRQHTNTVLYASDGEPYRYRNADGEMSEGLPIGFRWKPSIHMPRWASRITLEIEEVRIQRLQDISEEDAVAEGVKATPDRTVWHGRLCVDGNVMNVSAYCDTPPPDWEQPYSTTRKGETACEAYRTLWEAINGKGSWDLNPWVWAVTFKCVAQEGD